MLEFANCLVTEKDAFQEVITTKNVFALSHANDAIQWVTLLKSVENPFALIVNVLGIPNRDVLTSVETNCVLETECMTEFPVQEIPTVVFVTSKVIWILNVSKDVSIHNAKLLDFTPNTQENKYLFMKEVVY
jgi:hypothetical protein